MFSVTLTMDTPYSIFIGEEQCPFNHEEADVNIIRYLLLLHEDKSHVQVTADGTDIFLLLVYHVWRQKLTTKVSMKKHDGTIIDINATVAKLGDKCKSVLPLHAMTGCDCVISLGYGQWRI